MRFALARKLGWSSTIRTVLPMVAILADAARSVHGADHTAEFGNPPPLVGSAEPQDACQQPVLGWSGLGGSPCVRVRHTEGIVDERQRHCHPRRPDNGARAPGRR